jgi:hypothetical protein
MLILIKKPPQSSSGFSLKNLNDYAVAVKSP